MEHNVNFPDKERIKAHWQKNKKLYYGIGIGAVIMLAIRRPVVISVAPAFNNIPVFNNNQINFAGHLTKLVKNLDTGQVWETVTEAANAAGVGISAMSKHLNGHPGFEHLFGQRYSIVGIGTTG